MLSVLLEFANPLSLQGAETAYDGLKDDMSYLEIKMTKTDLPSFVTISDIDTIT